MDPSPVVGGVLVHDKRWSVGKHRSQIDRRTHYWALRQQARSPLRPELWETGGDRAPGVGVGLVVAPLWWWGVVFDLWIVVASI
jgi:hypothetical protein